MRRFLRRKLNRPKRHESSVASKKCPVCATSVRFDRLELHLSNVHPSEAPRFRLTKAEREEARQAGPAGRSRARVSRTTAALVLGAALLVLGVGAAVVYVPRSQPEQMTHWHPTLSISIEGVPQVVPANIGIDRALYNYHGLDSNSMMSMAPLHTHDTSGQIHVEWMGSTEAATLGNFFRIWGQTFDSGQLLGHPAGPGHAVRMIVNGEVRAPSTSLAFQDAMTIELVCDVA